MGINTNNFFLSSFPTPAFFSRIANTLQKNSLINSLIQNIAMGVFFALTMALLKAVYLRIQACIRSPQRQELIKILEVWQRDSQATGNKDKAYRRIMDAFDQRAVGLSFYGLNLNSLPLFFAFLRILKNLT